MDIRFFFLIIFSTSFYTINCSEYRRQLLTTFSDLDIACYHAVQIGLHMRRDLQSAITCKKLDKIPVAQRFSTQRRSKLNQIKLTTAAYAMFAYWLSPLHPGCLPTCACGCATCCVLDTICMPWLDVCYAGCRAALRATPEQVHMPRD